MEYIKNKISPHQIKGGQANDILTTNADGKVVWQAPANQAGGASITRENLTHVGQIIISTTLDTADKVSAFYGGVWMSFAEGRTIVGMGSNGETNYQTLEEKGGSDNVTLTVAQMPSHSHWAHTRVLTTWHDNNHPVRRDGTSAGSDQSDGEYTYDRETDYTGGNQPHENRPAYITAYIWKRVL